MRRSLPARVVAVLLVAQLFASGITIGRGFPYYGSSMVDNAPVWEIPIALWHWPAIEMLSASGYCCGLRNQLVFEARVRGGHVPMKPFGALVLAGTSMAFWSIISLTVLMISSRRVRETGKEKGETGLASPSPFPPSRSSLEEPSDHEEPERGGGSESEHAGHGGHEDPRQQ